jgi:SAM-dependent methyltransferase
LAVAGRARVPTRLRSRIASSRLTARPYRAVFEWIDDYASEVVGRRGFDRLLPPLALQIIYEIVLGRSPDPIGRASFLPELESGTMSNRDFLQLLRGCNEGLAYPPYSGRYLASSLHESRIRFVRMLPRACRIVDLGGNSVRDPRGALVSYGYPYRFDSLVVVDLPSPERHVFYQSDHYGDTVDTDQGPVSYRYHSMVDLADFADASADLVYCGQAIEHVTAEEATLMAKEVYRILAPGGCFALDTPNARLTRLQQAEFVDPDHKYEYTWPELSRLLAESGFVIDWAKGLNYGGMAAGQERFDADEVAGNCGLFDDLEDCYLLAAVARKGTFQLSETQPATSGGA